MSNLGLEQYLPEWVSDPSRGHWHDNSTSDMYDVGGHVMESDEHETLFCEEAESWFEKFKNLTVEETREQFHWNVGRKWFDDILDAPEEVLEKMR
jgi:type II secretory pathway component PulJ